MVLYQVKTLIKEIQKEVYKTYNIQILPEIRLVEQGKYLNPFVKLG
jgi:UDP-N-acetylenolpyruvoylglucosamine reductase